jgi:glycerol-3-phosphate acyltransferase PlsX
VVLVDVGANIDCRPRHLSDFAIMGSIYAREIIGRRSPRVGLLNIGAEEGKGNDLSQATYKILSESDLNFIGNVEGNDLFHGRVDVVVCDGFVGNVVLKFAEGIVHFIMGHLKSELSKSFVSGLGAKLTLMPTLRRFKGQMDSSEYGGAPLLGVNGIGIVSHGASGAVAIKNAIRMAGECMRHDINGKIMSALNADGSENVQPMKEDVE